MSFATDKWFKHIRQEILTEGLNDIGLPQELVDIIRSNMPSASEKGRVWIGNAFKDTNSYKITEGGIELTSSANFLSDKTENEEKFLPFFQNKALTYSKICLILSKKKNFLLF